MSNDLRVFFADAPLLHRFMDGAMGVPAESRKQGGKNAGPNCISEMQHKLLKSLKSVGESF